MFDFFYWLKRIKEHPLSNLIGKIATGLTVKALWELLKRIF